MQETDQEIKIKLPPGFLLGAAMSAHQVEGNNRNSDWWYWETKGKLPASGDACDHYNRYEEDFQIAKNIGMNSLRISIEWARIEPVENQWDKVAIEHYRKVLQKMKELGLTRMVTLHHFTLPQWLAEKGGFETKAGVEAFARFCWFVAKNLGEEIDLWCTINEPGVYSTLGYLFGKWPPFKHNQYYLYNKVFHNLIRAHKSAYTAIKSVLPNAQIGAVNNCSYYEPQTNVIRKAIVSTVRFFNNEYFFRKIKSHQDFLGVNYYFYKRFEKGKRNFTVLDENGNWSVMPEGIYHILIRLKKFKKPIYITENGIANANEEMRKDFIRQHVHYTNKAINDGVDVKGYYYWSLIDNYEWSDGFSRLFGLVEINYSTQERKIRPSAEVIKEIINA